jgi:hypothetical protein
LGKWRNAIDSGDSEMMRASMLLRAVALRVCDAALTERIVDPVLLDLEVEYVEARDHGNLWSRGKALTLGYIAVLKVVVLCGGSRLIRVGSELALELGAVALATVRRSLLLMTFATAALWVGPLLQWSAISHFSHPMQPLPLASIPQVLSVSLPVGLMFTVLLRAREFAASPAHRASVVLIAVVTSLLSFANVMWLAPNSNRLYRIQVAGAAPPKGSTELTLPEIRQILATARAARLSTSDVRQANEVKFEVQTRFSLSVTPLIWAIFALTVIRRLTSGVVLVLCGIAVGIGYFACLYSAHRAYPDVAYVAWLPNVFIGLSSVVSAISSWHRPMPTMAAVR